MSSTFRHARRLAGYNWPRYAGAGAAAILGSLIASSPAVPSLARWGAAVAVVAIGWFAAASFAAFHWMFDRSELLGGRWLADELPRLPARWVQISNGLDQTALPLREIFPGAAGVMIDSYDPASMTASALTRARHREDSASTRGARQELASIEDRWADVVVVMLAAHEIRDRHLRERFFQEIARMVASSGRVVLVEHVRNFVAAAAFGPGVFHFMPRSEWLRLGSVAGLTLSRERHMTPFVRVFVYTA